MKNPHVDLDISTRTATNITLAALFAIAPICALLEPRMTVWLWRHGGTKSNRADW